MEQVHYINHPVLTHKISILRNKKTRPAVFRNLVQEIGMIEAYEALRHHPSITKEVETPLEVMEGHFIQDSEICFVSILRAGLEMGHGARDILPNACEGFISMARDEVTFKPTLSYAKLPAGIKNKHTIILDPMLATGGSSIAAVKLLREAGANVDAFCCIIAAPEGVKAFAEACPDVELYVGALDRELNEKAYILPGLGDAGDRIYNTVD